MRRFIALSLTAVLAAGGCGNPAAPASVAPTSVGSPAAVAPAGGSPAGGSPAGGSATAGPAGTAVPGSPSPTPGGGPIAVTPPAPGEIAAALATPIATANAAGDRVIRALVDATGIGANGAALDGPVSALLAAEHQAATEAFIRLGGDPAKLQAARPAVSLAAWHPVPARSRQASGEATGAIIGMAGLAVGWVQLMMEVDRAGHDDKGFVRANTELAPVTSVTDGLTITLTQSLGIDLAHCPDPSGLAEGTITWDLTVVAAGSLDGAAVSGSANASFSILVTATAADDASLAEFTTTATGTIVAAAGSDGGNLSLDGVGFGMSVAGGEPDPSTAVGYGTSSGALDGRDEIIKMMARLTGVLAGTNGMAAQRWWAGNHCVRLEADPSLTATADSNGGADLAIRAVSVVDEADVEGKLTVEPGSGDFSPLEGTAPLTVRGTVAKGEAQAEAGLSFVSRRGTATAEVAVETTDYKVDLNFKGMTLTGRKCGGPAGAWKLKVGGQTTVDGFTASWSGSINFRLDEAGAGTYTVNIKLTAKGLPAVITAGLALDGGGKARFDAEAKMLRILDGTIGGSASATAPNASAFFGLDPQNADSAALPVLAAACSK